MRQIYRAGIGFALALALSGCSKVYSKPGASVAEFNQDKLQCEYQATSATASYGVPQQTTGGIGGAMGSGFGAGMAEGFKKLELMDLCLRSKGWAQVQP